MIPGSVDITVYQGDTYTLFFRVRNQNPDGTPGAYIDLTGYVGLAQIRAKATDPDPPLATFAVTLADQVLSRGGVTLTLTPAQTAPLPVTGGVWDVQLTAPDGSVHTYLAGNVIVLQQVSR